MLHFDLWVFYFSLRHLSLLIHFGSHSIVIGSIELVSFFKRQSLFIIEFSCFLFQSFEPVITLIAFYSSLFLFFACYFIHVWLYLGFPREHLFAKSFHILLINIKVSQEWTLLILFRESSTLMVFNSEVFSRSRMNQKMSNLLQLQSDSRHRSKLI